MNAKTILEGLFGWVFEADYQGNFLIESPTHTKRVVGRAYVSGYCEGALDLKFGSVQKAAEEAAKRLNYELDDERYDWGEHEQRWFLETSDGASIIREVGSHIDLIAEAVEAGWRG